MDFSKQDIFVPLPPSSSSSSKYREQPTTQHITEKDLRRAEESTGLKANVYLPSSAPLEHGSLSATHRDVHGIREAFTSGDTNKVDLARPPFAKKLPPHVLHEMIDWERVKEKELDKLRSDKVYQFLAMLATTARIDVAELLENNLGSLAVGADISESRETAEVTETPEPLETIPTIRRKRRPRRMPFEEEEDVPQTDIEFPSGAPVRRRRKKMKAEEPMNFIRADFDRRDRHLAYDSQSWLRRVEVIGRFSISDRAITTINFNYTRILANAPSLNGVHVRHFMIDEHVNTQFALLCGQYLNYNDFMSRRTYIEVSMNNVYVKTMNSAIMFFMNNVEWNEEQRKLIVLSRNDNRLCQFNRYNRIAGNCMASSAVLFCPTGTSYFKLYP